MYTHTYLHTYAHVYSNCFLQSLTDSYILSNTCFVITLSKLFKSWPGRWPRGGV